MTDDNELAPATAEVAAPEAEAEGLTPTADEAALDSEPSTEDQTETKDDEPKSDAERVAKNMRRRIDKLVGQRGQLTERNAQLERELAELKASRESDDKPEKGPDPEKLADEIADLRETAKVANRVWADATKKFPDFKEVMTELVEEIGPQFDAKGKPAPLMAAVLESEHAASILHHLGKHPEVAAELAGIRKEAVLGRRIGLLEKELEAAAKPKQSAAPKPLAPVKPAAVEPAVDPTKLTDAQWRAKRLAGQI